MCIRDRVLKDAASTAIYGARANNGVILVTTKKGVEGLSLIHIFYSLRIIEEGLGDKGIEAVSPSWGQEAFSFQKER